MEKCEHIIGLWNSHGSVYNITLKELKKEIKDDNEYIQYLKKEHRNMWETTFHKIKEKNIKYYCDSRKATNLEKYNYCPKCGEKINWKYIKESNK